MRVLALCAYLTRVDSRWRGHDHDSRKLVRLLKGEGINGFANIRLPTQSAFRIENDEGSRREALDAFGKWAVARLRQEIDEPPVALVPLPSSSSTDFGDTTFASYALAEAIVRAAPAGKARIEDVLRFRQAHEPCHKSARRLSREDLRRNLFVAGRVDPNARIVLIDDICTQGNHLWAARDVLAEADLGCELAVVAGRTVHYQLDECFDLPAEDLPDGDPQLPGYRTYYVDMDPAGRWGRPYFGLSSFWMPVHRRGDFNAAIKAALPNTDLRWNSIDSDTAPGFCRLIDHLFKKQTYMWHGIITKERYLPGRGVPFFRRMLLQQKLGWVAEGASDKAYRVRLSPGGEVHRDEERELRELPNVASLRRVQVFESPSILLSNLLLQTILYDWSERPMNPGQMMVRDAIAGHLGWPDLRGDTHRHFWKFNIWTYYHPRFESRPFPTREVTTIPAWLPRGR